ncbi:MAG: NHL repeat-containing protein, partial [Candidatus Diapherotrites archaeon]|nr:NHL repeat-containing protein [Candidatus Diapherotrites archaeon]
KYLGKIAGSQGSGNNQFNDPRDFAFDSKGNIYVADKENSRVQVFDSEGKYVATIGGKKGSGDYEFNSPRAVAVDSKGRVFVVDNGNERVQVFDSSFKYLSTLKGNASFQFKEPVPIAIDSADNIYVADSKSSNIHVFNTELSFVKDIDVGSDIIEMEGGIAFDSRGRLLVVDIEGNKVRMIDPETGNVTKTIGEQGATGNYSFDWPHGLAIAPNGDVFVVDMGNRRIQVYDSQLNFKRTIAGGADGLIETSG